MAKKKKRTLSTTTKTKSTESLDLVTRLMAIDGKSGQEGEVAQFVTDQLLAAGAPKSAIRTDSANRRTPILGETGNLVLKLPGTRRGPRRLLMAHLDTVPICVGSKPVRKGDWIHSSDPKTGLGADDRAGVGVILSAALEILRRGLPHPPLTFCWTIQEETGLQGVKVASIGLLGKPQLAFNFDGGAPDKLTIGATGGYRMKIEIEGIASHAGGAPEKGVSAIAIASLAIADLVQNGWHGDIRKGNSLGTSNVGLIQGGEATNVVTDHVLVKAEARSHDPKFRKKIVAQIEKAFRQAVKQVKSVEGKVGKVSIEGNLDYESFCLSGNEPCVLEAEKAVKSISRTPQRAIANGGVDANWMVLHGIPTVTLGCGQRDQHTVKESLSVSEYLDACQIAIHLATGGEEQR